MRAVQLWHAAPDGSVFGVDLVLLIAGRILVCAVSSGGGFRGCEDYGIAWCRVRNLGCAPLQPIG